MRELAMWAKKSLMALGIVCALMLCVGQQPAAAQEKIGGEQPALQQVIQRRARSEQVINTFWSYSCPRNVPGHDVTMFDISYKVITFNNYYVRDNTAHPTGADRYVDMCSCPGLGLAIQFKYNYTLH